MRLGLILAMAFAISGCLDKGSKKGSKSVKLDTLEQKVSYVYGQQIGREMKNQGINIDTDIMMASIEDAIAGKEPRLKQAEMQSAMREMQTKLREKREKEASVNLEAGKKYLEANKSKEGVTATASGLQYRVLKATEGRKPKATDKVRVHYKGTLTDGSEFDSSYKRGQAAEFPLNRVIKGWTEGLQLMSVGSKFQFFIPSNLAYGKVARPTIPANSVLVFEVELLGIVDPPKKDEAKKGK